MIRPVSQTGFHRIPHNPHQRVSQEGGVKASGEVLDAFNERQEDRSLHPTKGFRKLSVRRGRAQAIIANVMNGGSANLSAMLRFFQHGY